MPPKPKLETFDSLANVPCYYARVNAAYGDLSKATKSRKRKLASSFLNRLNACIAEIYWMTFGPLGPLEAITSGGAYVRKAGWHSKGKAYDLGGLHWPGAKLILIELAKEYHQDPENYPEEYPWYLAIESIIRRHFGTVLGIHYNRAHWNHWHIDPGTKVGFWDKGFGSQTRITFLQAILKTIWGCYDGELDGDCGPKTQKAIEEIRKQLILAPLTNPGSWGQLLLMTAVNGLHM
jgi:hypothetical protein